VGDPRPSPPTSRRRSEALGLQALSAFSNPCRSASEGPEPLRHGHRPYSGRGGRDPRRVGAELLSGVVHDADVVSAPAREVPLDKVATTRDSIRKVRVDSGYRKHLVEHAATLGIDMHIVQRAPGRDSPTRSEATMHLAMTDLMARRLTGGATISWRESTSPEQLRIPGRNNGRNGSDDPARLCGASGHAA
jgi:hypothetical protein